MAQSISMPSTRRVPSLLAVTVLTLTTGVAAQETWKVFRSPTAFSVAYPPSWRRIGISTDRLDILSSAAQAEGVVIARDEAEIIVVEVRDSARASLPQVIDHNQEGDSILLRRDLPGAPDSVLGCGALKEVVSRSQVGPGAYEIDAVFYCALRGREFTTTLRYWPEDKQQAEYRSVALRVARSLRVGS